LWGVFQFNFYISFIGIAATGFCITALWSYTFTRLQHHCDDEFLGRVIAYNDMLFFIVSAVTSAAIGFLFEFGVSLSAITMIMAGCFLVAGFYYKFVYNGGKEKSIIICPVHGEFEMTPNAHLRGQGCPICGIEATADKLRGNKEDFIKKAQEIHGDKYDYSKVNYVNYKTKVEIICKKHGPFLMTPCNHIQNQAGCPKCAHQQSKSEKEYKKFKCFL